MSDPSRGTRLMVSHVLAQVASGMAWETSVDTWRRSIAQDTMAKAVRLAMRAFVDHLGSMPSHSANQRHALYIKEAGYEQAIC